MPTSTQTSLLELQIDVWKTRAQTKQKWLERTLAEPAKTPREARRQLSWIMQALDSVKRGQDELKYQTALLDVYAEHLNALEMSLMSEAEKRSAADGERKGSPL